MGFLPFISSLEREKGRRGFLHRRKYMTIHSNTSKQADSPNAAMSQFMGQFQVWAMIYVRKVKNIYSHQAQRDGDFMRQKWRIYGLSNNASTAHSRTRGESHSNYAIW